MNRLLCILKDLESGVTLMKDPKDLKEWTEKDLVRMWKKKIIQGYDVEYNGNFVVFGTDEIQYAYLIGGEQVAEAMASEAAMDSGVEYGNFTRASSAPAKEVMFG